MKAVHTELHRSHDPQFFLVRGVVKRTTEQPERADRLLKGLKDGKHQLVEPTQFGQGPRARIHSPEYLSFLSEAWDAWTAERAEANRAATIGLTDREAPTPAQADRAVRLLATAAAARPEVALYEHELGQAHLARALTRPADSPERTADLREALRHWRRARDLSPVMAPTPAWCG